LVSDRVSAAALAGDTHAGADAVALHVDPGTALRRVGAVRLSGHPVRHQPAVSRPMACEEIAGVRMYHHAASAKVAQSFAMRA